MSSTHDEFMGGHPGFELKAPGKTRLIVNRHENKIAVAIANDVECFTDIELTTRDAMQLALEIIGYVREIYED